MKDINLHVWDMEVTMEVDINLHVWDMEVTIRGHWG